MVGDGAFSHKIDYIANFVGYFKSPRASKSHYWFKRYGNFAEWMDFAYWWSFSGGGPVINWATPSSLETNQLEKGLYFFIALHCLALHFTALVSKQTFKSLACVDLQCERVKGFFLPCEPT